MGPEINRETKRLRGESTAAPERAGQRRAEMGERTRGGRERTAGESTRAAQQRPEPRAARRAHIRHRGARESEQRASRERAA
ncbi:hypothetical protein CesoFtcFv8_026581 [Champsocephalus esox]|uniref:Uncharacterized protein n=1 Tax=Champsocephalus esox TaxID=159716 RepID=A0AAN8AZF5_9TELE|nr:hypothetical protein CesoFtcFv8_026581 [Champsocephalus esox]